MYMGCILEDLGLRFFKIDWILLDLMVNVIVDFVIMELILLDSSNL